MQILFAMATVSYTHLDVYKRQLLSLDSLTIKVCLTLYGFMIMSVLIFLYLVYKYRTKELGLSLIHIYQSIDPKLFEAIFIVNGELDSTPDIIKKYQEENPQINIILTYS